MPVRSRTATSNGMRNVQGAADVAGDAYRWRPTLAAQYNVTTGALKAANAALTANEAAIARAQMQGNCHRGWSCKDKALAQLRDLGRGGRRLAQVQYHVAPRRGRVRERAAVARPEPARVGDPASPCRHWMLTDTVPELAAPRAPGIRAIV